MSNCIILLGEYVFISKNETFFDEFLKMFVLPVMIYISTKRLVLAMKVLLLANDQKILK